MPAYAARKYPRGQNSRRCCIMLFAHSHLPAFFFCNAYKKVHNPYLRIIHRKTYNPDFKGCYTLTISSPQSSDSRSVRFYRIAYTPRQDTKNLFYCKYIAYQVYHKFFALSRVFGKFRHLFEKNPLLKKSEACDIMTFRRECAYEG